MYIEKVTLKNIRGFADLIVLGKHGTGMVEELLLGSITTHVLAQARPDVLVATR